MTMVSEPSMADAASAPTPEQVVRAMAVKGYNRTYAIVPGDPPVTFLSQQKRAFNLIWALFECQLLSAGCSLGIVGGGLAGVTCAAAAASKGVNVTLYEKNQRLFHHQIQNTTRFIQPNIALWPRKEANDIETHLPFLNWAEAECRDVLDDVMAQFKSFTNVEQILEFNVNMKIHETDDKKFAYIRREARGEYKRFDIVIVCCGFGIERPFEKIDSISYWALDDLQHLNLQEKARVLVSGTGDGGLIDFTRLCLPTMSHREIIASVAMHDAYLKMAPELLELESTHKSISHDNAFFLAEAYESLEVHKCLPDILRRHRAPSYRIDLAGTGPSPFRLGASIINKVIAFGLLRGDTAVSDQLGYIEGPIIEAEQTDSGGARVRTRDSDNWRDYNRVLIRHGPAGALASLVGKDGAQQTTTAVTVEIGRCLLFPPGFFPEPARSDAYRRRMKQIATRHADALEAKLAKLGDGSARLHRIELDPGFGAVFSVLAKPEISDLPDSYAHIPVRRVTPDQVRHASPTGSRQVSGIQHDGPLYCGTGIRADNGAYGLIGCFVRHRSGAIGFITPAHIFSWSGFPEIGCEVYRASTPHSKGQLIGKLHSYILGPGPTVKEKEQAPARYDIAFVELASGIEVRNELRGDDSVLALDGLVDADNWEIGDDVIITSNPGTAVTGTVTAIEITGCVVSFNNIVMTFEDLFEVTFREFESVNNPGVSGSLVLTKSGGLMGMIFAGNTRPEFISFAFWLKPALAALDCELLIASDKRPEFHGPDVVILRGVPLMTDTAAAMAFGVATRQVNQAVKRNPELLADRYSFVASPDDEVALRSQTVISNPGSRGGRRYGTRLFTQKGIVRLAMALRSERASKAIDGIIDLFIEVHRQLARGESVVTVPEELRGETPQRRRQIDGIRNELARILRQLLDHRLGAANITIREQLPQETQGDVERLLTLLDHSPLRNDEILKHARTLVAALRALDLPAEEVGDRLRRLEGWVSNLSEMVPDVLVDLVGAMDTASAGGPALPGGRKSGSSP